MVSKALKAVGDYGTTPAEIFEKVILPQGAQQESDLVKCFGPTQLEHATEVRWDGYDNVPTQEDHKFETLLGPIFVKRSVSKKLSHDLIPILKRYQGDGFASIFNENMELELQVQSKYEQTTVQQPHRWNPAIDSAVK